MMASKALFCSVGFKVVVAWWRCFNLKQYPIIRTILVNNEYRSNRRSKMSSVLVVVNATVNWDSGCLVLSSGFERVLGQLVGSSYKNSDPPHQSGWLRSSDGKRPLDAQSTGLTLVGTYRHMEGVVRSCNWLTQLATNVVQQCGDDFIHANVVIESVQACVHVMSMTGDNTSTTDFSSFATSSAPHSSRRGMVTRLSGATLDFAVTRWQITGTLKYLLTP